MTTLREAAQALVDKIPIAEEAARSIYTTAYIHGVKYDGPTYEAELNALRAALAAPSPNMEEIERLLRDYVRAEMNERDAFYNEYTDCEEYVSANKAARAALLAAIGDAIAQARREGIEAAEDVLRKARHNLQVAAGILELKDMNGIARSFRDDADAITRALGAAP